MKRKIKFLIPVLFSILFISAAPQEKSGIIGPWRFYKALGPGAANPNNNAERFMIFNEDNTFYGSSVYQNKRRPYNWGYFYIIDRKKLVTVHSNPSGKTEKAGNVYTYRINSDTLHLDGFYFRQSPMDTMVYLSVPINEIWIRDK